MTRWRLVAIALTMALFCAEASAQIARVGVTAGATARTNDRTLSHAGPPAGVIQDDVLFAVISISGPQMTSIDPPAGWNVVDVQTDPGHNQAVYSKLAGAAEAGPYDFTWTFPGSASGNDRVASYIMAYRDVDPASTFAAAAGSFDPSVGNTLTAPSITPPPPDTVLIGVWGLGRNGGGGTLPPGMSNAYSLETGAGPGGITLLTGDEPWPPSGTPTGTRTATFATSAVGNGQLIAVRRKRLIDHVRLLHDASALTCGPETVTIQVCQDASCSLLFTEAVTIALAPTGWVGGDSISFSGGSASHALRHTTPGIVTLDAAVMAPTPALNPTRCFVGAVETCALEFHEAGFVFDVPGLIAGQDSAAVTVSAVKADPMDPQTCAPAFTGARSVAIWSSYLSPATGTLPVRVDGNAIAGASPGTALTLNFDASAQAQIVIAYDDAGLMNVDLRHEGSGAEAGLVMLGSDQFAVRPETLCVRAPQANSDCSPVDPACSAFVGAGRDFVLELRAVRWVSGSTDACSNPVTPNYQHGPVALTHALLAPVGGAAGTLAVSDATFVPADAGVHTVTTQQVSEVGVFEFTATPPAGYFGLTIPAGTSVPVGRFVPDHFDVVVEDGCTGGAAFTWSGQPFTATAMARNGAGTTTANYHGAFAFARDTELSDAGDTTGFSDNTIAAADFVNGIGSTSAVTFTHATSPQPPTGLGVRATDTDGVSSNGFLEGSTEVRSGRLRLSNGFGSGREDLPLPLSVQSWQDIDPPNLLYAWNTEAADTCTVLATTDFTLAGLATTVSAVDLAAGLGTVTLSAPNAYGHVDVTATLDTLAPWLQFDWDGDGTAQNPTARAGFELQPGSNRQIYRREVIGGN